MKILKFLLLALLAASVSNAYAQAGQTPGINDSYTSPRVDVQEYVERFESEGREVYDLRHEIVESLDLKPGMSVADVGAGTGLFVPLLAEAVGKQGTVYAVDIAPNFLKHIAERAKSEGLTQVKTVLGTERSIELPANSVDVIFTSDAYHHFVHYEDMLASMRRALKPNGQLVVVDFDIKAKELPRPMVRHVGKTKEEFTKQITEAGFKFAEDMSLPKMRTNFIYRFEKAATH